MSLVDIGMKLRKSKGRLPEANIIFNLDRWTRNNKDESLLVKQNVVANNTIELRLSMAQGYVSGVPSGNKKTYSAMYNAMAYLHNWVFTPLGSRRIEYVLTNLFQRTIE